MHGPHCSSHVEEDRKISGVGVGVIQNQGFVVSPLIEVVLSERQLIWIGGSNLFL